MRTRHVMLLTSLLALAALLLGTSAARAAGTPEQQCQAARYKEAGKYVACQQKVMAKLYGGTSAAFDEALAKCTAKYTGKWSKLQAKASGTGSTCDNDRFEDDGNGTVTDWLTGLQWEQKTDDATIHDKDDVYSWSAGGGGFLAADGDAFTIFLPALNGGGCFAGQCDWRLPTIAELQTILLAPFPCATSPCIDEAVFGPTAASFYWSATTGANYPNAAWSVNFGNGNVYYYFNANSDGDVRAVRSGL